MIKRVKRDNSAMVCLHKWQLEYTWFLSILLLTWFAHSNTMHGVRCGATYTEGRYGAGAGAGVLGWACFSSKVEFQGFAPGVLGDIGIVGVVGVTGISTYIDQGEKSFYNDQQNLLSLYNNNNKYAITTAAKISPESKHGQQHYPCVILWMYFKSTVYCIKRILPLASWSC